MSINQYSSDFNYHTLMWQQQQQRYQMEQNFQSDVVVNDIKVALFEKALTPSDVGKLNRLVIPKQYAERHFPLSGATADVAVVDADKGFILCFEDEEGKPWRFRYSYWNSSQSYVLTKGWSRYVKEKHLDAGDVVYFHRHRTDGQRLFIGWRRRGSDAARPSTSSSESYLHPPPNGSHCPLQYYQPEYPKGEQIMMGNERVGMKNSKTLRLFGVDMQCQLGSDWSEPSTPDGSVSCPSHQHHF